MKIKQSLFVGLLLMIIVIVYLYFYQNHRESNHEIDQTSLQSQETLRMIKRLEFIYNYTDPMSSSFLNNERLLILKQNTTIQYSANNVTALNTLANEHLKAGNSETASEIFENLLKLILKNKETYTASSIDALRKSIAISNLRIGEQSNCIMLHGAQSCIFPISKSAQHLNQIGSKKAMQQLSLLLEKSPNDIALKWLYNIAAQTVGDYPHNVPTKWLIPMSHFESESQMPAFTNIAKQTNTDIVDLAGGSVAEDFNNDGHIDLMVSAWGFNSQIKLLINNGEGQFEDVTNKSGLMGLVGGLNMVSADYDNDGDTDVLVLRGGWKLKNGLIPNSLLMNDGHGYFSDVTESANILSFHPTQTAAWGDYDNDGWLDLFIGNESITGDLHYSELYHNNQDGTFSESAKSVGLQTSGYIKGTAWGDYNNDGKIDLYVSRMDQSNQLFQNNCMSQNCVFKNVSKKAGVGNPIHSFPTWFWDFNNDGWLDVFVADYDLNAYISPNEKSLQVSQVIQDYISEKTPQSIPRLYQNNQDGTFTDVTIKQNLDHTLVAMGANFGDIDNDGYLDMYIGTGDPDFRTLIPNRMFRNNQGKYFQDVTTTNAVGHLQKGHAISFADFDNDGDQDIYAVMGGAYSGDFFQNALFLNPGHGNNWLTLKLIGSTSNTSAIGARVKVIINENNQLREIHRVVGTGGSFGANSLQLEIGLSQATTIEKISVIWPSQITQEFSQVQVNQHYLILENNNNIVPIKKSKP